MSLSSSNLWRKFTQLVFSRVLQKRRGHSRKRAFRLRLEELESRFAPASIVTSAVATHGHATIHGFLTPAFIGYSQVQGGPFNGANEISTRNFASVSGNFVNYDNTLVTTSPDGLSTLTSHLVGQANLTTGQETESVTITGATGSYAGTTGGFSDLGYSTPNGPLFEDSTGMLFLPPGVAKSYNASTWNDEIIGNASATAGILGVSVSLQDNTGGTTLYWNGTSFVAASAAILLPATVAADGSWSLAVPHDAMTDGHTYTVFCQATDTANNVQATPGQANFTYDLTAPAAPPVPVLAAASDSGLQGDNITNVVTPTLTGTAEPFSSVQIMDDGPTFLGQAVADATGHWSFTVGGSGSDVPSLAGGTHDITVTATDAADNISAPSNALVLVVTPASLTRTYTVTNLLDTIATGDGISLREAITAATAGGDFGDVIHSSGDPHGGKVIINFDPGLSGTITLGSALPGLSSDIEIDGPGADTVIVSGANQFEVFNVAANVNATIKDLAITDGMSATNGGGIENQGNLTVSGCLFSDNVASNAGGAISSAGVQSQLHVTNCQFQTGFSGPNSATYGGGIDNYQGQLVVSGSTFEGNSASIAGGGISNSGTFTSPGQLAVDTSTFTGNSARDGGGIDNFESNATIIACTFANNVAEFGATPSGVAAGGGIENVDGVMKVINSTLTMNSATGTGTFLAFGGGIENFKQSGTAVLILTNTTVAGNSASTAGGGIDNNSSTTLHNSIVAGNVRQPEVSPIPGDIAGQVEAEYSLIQTTGVNTLTAASANNITGVDPLLGPLDFNGGPTQTMLLYANSPAINKGSNALATDASGTPLATDQRGAGFPRKVGTVDIGALEAQPVVLTPNIGGPTGNTLVKITGDLAQVQEVDFGAGNAGAIQNSTPTEIDVITPPSPLSGGNGAVTVYVQFASDRPALVIPQGFTYTSTPLITGISPATGTTAGQTQVIISGANLDSATAVQFGAVPASFFYFDSFAGTLTAYAPPHAAGTVDVRVTTPTGTTAITAADQFTFVTVPTVYSLSPNVGPAAGGTSVTIFGNDLSGVTGVMFGNTPATFQGAGNFQIIATSPPGTVGDSVPVTVSTATFTTDIASAPAFTYQGPPTVTGISPATGSTFGGTFVTITGTNLMGATLVHFGTGVANSIISSSDTSLTVIAPAGIAGTEDVTVTTPVGTSPATPADQFTFVVLPTIVQVTPAVGSITGGTSVTITGLRLANATAVDFGGVAATSFTNISDGKIVAVSPPGTTGQAVDISVTSSLGTSESVPADEFTYESAPTVSDVSPNTGSVTGGTFVSITGTNLLGATSVKFGGVASTFVTYSDTEIQATSPPGAAGTVNITVTTPVGTSTISAADHFTYSLVPVLTSLSPEGGPAAGGTVVTLTGTSLNGATAVKFGSKAAAFTVVSATKITATAPAGTLGTSVDVTVTTPYGTSSLQSFLYEGSPTVTGVSPASGTTLGNGSYVEITGTNLLGATAVSFGGVPSTNFFAFSATGVEAAIPSHALGVVDVKVTTPSGTSAVSAADQFTYVSAPTIASVSPSSGPPAGGTEVTIKGSNLAGTSTVVFGQTPGILQSVSANQVVAVSPPGLPGTVNVQLYTDIDATAITPGDQFTYQGITTLPTVSNVTPRTASRIGGTLVTITGTNLDNATFVDIGSIQASIVSDSATQIVISTPTVFSPATSHMDVRVTTTHGTSVKTTADLFQFFGDVQALAFVTGAQALRAGQASGTIIVQLRDANGNEAVTDQAVQVSLGSTSGGGTFYDLAGNPVGAAALTIPAGESSAEILYKDSVAGKPTLTLSASGLTTASQQETVLASGNLHVTNTSDSGAGSLRQAITSANAAPGSVIVFDAGAVGTIDLLSALPNLAATTTILGPGANVLTVERKATAVTHFGIFDVLSGATVTIADLTLANADGTGVVNNGTLTLRGLVIQGIHSSGLVAVAPYGGPGGVLNTGTLSIFASTIANNTTANTLVAAGVDSEAGAVFIVDSTISDNTANHTNSAGGIGIYGGTLYLANSTVSGNVANDANSSGGGIDASGTSAIIYDTIVAGNTGAAQNQSDVNGDFTSLGHNLIGSASLTTGFVASDQVGTVASPINALLDPTLKNNGGTTPTHALMRTSPAVNAGDNTGAPPTDQRGVPRIFNGVVDIGAYEFNVPPLTPTTAPQATFTAGIFNTFTVDTTPDQTGTGFATLSETGDLPAGVSFTPNADGTATISGTPARAASVFLFNIECRFAGNLVFTQTFTLTLVTPPAYTSPDHTTFTAGQPVGTNFLVMTAAGLPTKTTITYSGALPTGVTLVDQSNGTAKLGGSPAAGTTYSYPITITAANGSAVVATQAFTLTLYVAPALTVQPANQTVAVGNPVMFTAAASGNPSPTVQWQVAPKAGGVFAPINGATSPSYTFTPTLADNGKQFRAVFMNSAGTATSNPGTLTVDVPPAITQQPPAGGTFPVNKLITITAAASGTPAPTVQWQISTDNGVTFKDFAGATSTTFSFTTTAALNGAQARAHFKNPVGEAFTDVGTLIVVFAPAITTQPASQTISLGNPVTFTAAANGNPPPTVQWLVAPKAGGVFAPINGATSPSYTFTPMLADSGKVYQAVFTNSIASAATITALLTVDVPPAITQQPLAGGTFFVSKPVSISAVASGTPVPTVQWQISTDNGATFKDIALATATTYNFTTTAALNGAEYRAHFKNAVGEAFTTVSTLTVNIAPAITTQPSSQTVTVGSPVTFTAAASGNPSPTVQWQVAPKAGGVFAPINGATSPSYTFTPAADDNGKQYQAVFTNLAGSIATNAAALTVNAPPVVTQQPAAGAAFLVNKLASITAAASGFPVPGVHWQISTDNGATFKDIALATAATYNFTTTAALNGTQYRAHFKNAVGEAFTTAYVLTVNIAPAITTQPSSQTITVGSPVTFTAAASGNPSPTVQWQVAPKAGGVFAPINGATSPSYTFTPAADDNGKQYQAVFTNLAGSIATNAAALTVNAPPAVTQQPAAGATFLVNKLVSITAAASGFPVPGVQWQASTDNGTTFKDIALATAATYNFTTTAALNGTQYRAHFKNAVGEAFTTAYVLTVNFVPAITTQPTSQTVAIGNPVTFTAAANGNPAPTVQWQVAPKAGGVFTPINGATSPSYTFTPLLADSGTVYEALFTNLVGSTATSAATLTVDVPPAVTQQPLAGGTFLVSKPVSIAAAASGTPALMVQWQISTDNGATFKDIALATAATYNFTTTAALNGTQYRAHFKNAVGEAFTTAYVLTVNFVPAITTQPTSQTVAIGNPVTFTAAANGNPAPTVQWQVAPKAGGAFTQIAGATSPSYTFTPVLADSGTVYEALFTNLVGSTATSAATLTVDVPPAVTQQPLAGGTFLVSKPVSIAAAASGTPAPTVQWQISTDNGTTFKDIGLATAATYNFTTTAALNGTQYRAHFKNAVGEAFTTAYVLTVNFVPAITTQPTSQTVAIGNPVTFTAAANGNPAPTVQWQVAPKAGVAFTHEIAGATSPSYTFTPVLADSGTVYEAFFTNLVGSTATSAATLTVDVPPAVTQQPLAGGTFLVSKPVSIAAAASGTPAPTVQWQISTDNGTTFKDIALATAATYNFTTTAALNGAEYRAHFKNAVGEAFTTVYTLTVNIAPAIMTQPSSQTVTVGSPVTFTAAASGNPSPTVQWQVAPKAGGVFAPINGATSPSYTFTPAADDNGKQYQAVFTNLAGSIATNAAALTVKAPPAVTQQPAAGATILVNKLVSITAAASGFPVPGVQWQASTDNGTTFKDIALATAATYSFTTTLAQSGTQFRAHFKNAVGEAFTTAYTLTVTQLAAFTSGTSAVFTVGQPGAFAVVTTGVPTPTISTSGLPAGVTLTDNGDGTAKLGGVPYPGTGGLYNLTITAHNGSGPDATQTFKLTVNQAPAITSAATDNFNVNQSNTFAIQTAGYPPVTVSLAGTLPAGITQSFDKPSGTLTLSGIPTVTGSYKIIVTVSNGILPDAIQELILNVI